MKRICSVVMIIMLGILLWGCSQKTENQELVEEIAGGIYQPNGIVYEVHYGEDLMNRKEDFYRDTISFYETKDYEAILNYLTDNDISIIVSGK